MRSVCPRKRYKYRALEALFKNAGEYISKLKSFTKKSAGLIDTSNAGVGMTMIVIVMAITLVSPIYTSNHSTNSHAHSAKHFWGNILIQYLCEVCAIIYHSF